MKNTYLIDIDTVKKNTDIDDSVPDKLIYRTITVVQDTMLKPILGATFYETLLSGINISGCTLSPSYKALVDGMISKVILAGIEYKIVDKVNYKISNRGVLGDKGQYADKISYAELEALKKERLGIFDFYASELRLFLEINRADYPEFYAYRRDAINSFENTENDSGVYCDVRVNPSYTAGNEINPAYGKYSSGIGYSDYYDSAN